MALQSGRCPQGLKLDLNGNQIGAEGAGLFALLLKNVAVIANVPCKIVISFTFFFPVTV